MIEIKFDTMKFEFVFLDNEKETKRISLSEGIKIIKENEVNKK
jgi:hypothetical protein